MRKRFACSVVKSVRIEQEIEQIIRVSGLDVSDLIEAGLISIARNPGTRKEKLLEAALSFVTERISYYEHCLIELEKVKDAPKQAAAQDKPKIHATTPVKTTDGVCIWVPAELLEDNPDKLKRLLPEEACVDAAADWPVIYSLEELVEV
jgi:hypothetical protein